MSVSERVSESAGVGGEVVLGEGKGNGSAGGAGAGVVGAGGAGAAGTFHAAACGSEKVGGNGGLGGNTIINPIARALLDP